MNHCPFNEEPHRYIIKTQAGMEIIAELQLIAIWPRLENFLTAFICTVKFIKLFSVAFLLYISKFCELSDKMLHLQHNN